MLVCWKMCPSAMMARVMMLLFERRGFDVSRSCLLKVFVKGSDKYLPLLDIALLEYFHQSPSFYNFSSVTLSISQINIDEIPDELKSTIRPEVCLSQVEVRLPQEAHRSRETMKVSKRLPRRPRPHLWKTNSRSRTHWKISKQKNNVEFSIQFLNYANVVSKACCRFHN
jgi:hypothetical protein